MGLLTEVSQKSGGTFEGPFRAYMGVIEGLGFKVSQTNRDAFLGVPIMRIIACWGIYIWVPLFGETSMRP